MAHNPIAIVGMSGLLPKARNHREYWQNIVDGVDCTEEVPASRWSLDDYYDPDPTAADKTYSRRGAFLPDIDFDPLEFGLPPNQLEVTSTMQTLSLGVARDLLVDAGAVDSNWYDPSRTGVVIGTTGPVPLMHPLAARLSTPVLEEAARSVGLSDDDARAIATKFVAAFAPWEENSFPGLLANVVAGRVANRLGLGGINCTVDAACAASMAAIRTAIAELLDGRADMVLTGGVDTENTIFIYMCFSKVGALSPTGRISPFSDGANGTLLGEGITMLALRRLEDARRDGNRVYAVIRGLGSSSDGRAKSIYAPRAEGQVLALRRAYADADCSPADIELFEAHATGTAVGDKTELTALEGVLSEASPERAFAALGTVKSQIGHTKGAAGTASVMKLALALHEKVLPGTINVDAPNALIAAEDAPFYVNTRTRPWILDPRRPVRRAAASAMGFGGTNFHLVLEESDQRRAGVVLHRTPRAHIWHAPDVSGLIDAVRSVASGDGGDIPDDHARVGFVSVDAESADHLRELAVDELIRDPLARHWDHPEGVFFRAAALPERRIGALFAGQGSQYVDMGAAAALDNPPVGAAFDAANAAFAGAPRRLSSVLFPAPAFDEQTRSEQELTLRRTEFAQPAIGALSAGQFRVLTEFGLRADGYLGHSFGELTALWAAGALADEDFHRLARARGVAMTPEDGVDAGTMMAVGATRDIAEELVAAVEDVWICNHNAPDQVVLGGGADGIAEVARVCAERGIVTRELPVSGAFHTPYVGHAVSAFGAAVASVRIGEPDAPVYADTPGVIYGADADANRAVLTEQLSKPVEFAAALTAMRDAGCTVFVEFGPKQVLTSLVRRTLGDDVIAIATDSGPVGDGSLALARAAVRLAVLGFDLRGLNRYGAPQPVAASAGSGMTVSLSAPEYVPQSRRAAYSAALSDGYRVSVGGSGSAGSGVFGGVGVAAPERVGVVAPGSVGAAVSGTAGVAAPGGVGVAGPGGVGVAVSGTAGVAVPGSVGVAAPERVGVAVSEGVGAAVSAPVAVGAAAPVANHSRVVERSNVQATSNDATHPGASQVPGVAPSQSAGSALSRAAEFAPSRSVDSGPVAHAAAEAVAARSESAHASASFGGFGSDTVDSALVQHMQTHRQYLDGQLDLARGLAGLLNGGTLDEYTVRAIEAVKDHGVTISESHAHAGEVLVQLAELESGAAPAVRAPAHRVAPTAPAPALERRAATAPEPAPANGHHAVAPAAPSPETNGAAETYIPAPSADPAHIPVAPPVPTTPVAPPASHTSVAPAPARNDSASAEELRRALQEVVAEKTGYPVEMVDPTRDLEADLGVDSIKRVQVIGALQERFPQLPDLGPEQLGTLRTLDQIVDLLGDSAAQAPAAQGAPAASAGIGSGPSDEELRRALQEVVAEKTGYPVEMVDPTRDLEADLGVDSIKRVQVIGALQERFPQLPDLGPEQLGTLRTLDQIVDLLGDSAAQAPAAQVSAGQVSAGQVPATQTSAGESSSAPVSAGGGGSSDEELRKALQEVVAEKTGYPVEMVDPTRDLEADLGVDSIKRVQVIGALQERFPHLPSLGPEQLGTLRTLDQIVAEFAAATGGDVHPKAEAAASTPRHLVESVELAPVDAAVETYRAGASVLLVDLAGESESDRAALESACTRRGWRVRTVRTVTEADGDDIDLCVVVVGGAADRAEAQRRLTEVILTAGRSIPRLLGAAGRAGFVTVTRLDGELGYRGGADPVSALLGGAGGAVKTLSAEQPSLFCRAVDIDPSVTGDRFAALLLDELTDSARDTIEVGIDATGARRTLAPSRHADARTVIEVRPLDAQPESVLTAEDVLVVTGGARGVTALCVLALARRSPARFVLFGRSEPKPEPRWALGVADSDLKQAALRALAGTGVTPRDIERECASIRGVREIRATLDELGDRAQYFAVDATDEAAVRAALEPVRESITGVVHGAGVLADSMITAKTEESIARVLEPKIGGLIAVLAALGDLRHLILFTSVAGLFGNAGQADYAAANEALCRFAVSYRAAAPDCHVTAIDWGAWDGGMVTPELREYFNARQIPLLPPESGAAAFTEQFTAERATDTVVLVGAATALSGPDTGAPPAVRARRTIGSLTEHPAIAAHKVGTHIVLPATFGLGAMINLAERRAPGRSVIGVREFEVLKGIVFDHPIAELDIELVPGDEHGALVRAAVYAEGAVRFRAELVLGDSVAAGQPSGQDVGLLSAPTGDPTDAVVIYRDGVQFHAPALQGMRTIRAASDTAIVLECVLPPATVANGAYAGRLHDPVQADLILQGPPVLGHRLLGAACLPLGVGRIDYQGPLPAGEPFLLIVDNPRAGRVDARIDATATLLDGTVLQRFSDVTVVTTPDLTEKFRTSVRQWMS
nr:type I polyketide synthase [Nocardia bovistercoris]